MTRKFTLELEDHEVDLMMQTVTQAPLPYVRVAPFVQKVNAQLQAQLTQPDLPPIDPDADAKVGGTD